MSKDNKNKEYWHSRNRPYWKEDPTFLNFQDRLFNESWDFAQTWEICKISQCFPPEKMDQIKKTTKKGWLYWIRKWNQEREINKKKKIVAFAAISYLFMVLPYQMMINDCTNEFTNFQVFTNFQINQFNIISIYNRKKSLPFKDLQPFMSENDGGPILPAAYLEWLDTTYDQACWWVCYTVYERINGLEPVVGSQ